MTGKDEYYNRAKQENYRARSAYKLRQMDDIVGLFDVGDTVVDLGAAPGGWMQVAAERVEEAGYVVGVDRQRIDPLAEDEAGHDTAPIETVRGDMTAEDTREQLRETVGAADAVVSDMAPNMTGEYSVDHARSVHLARQAFGVAEDVLAPGGVFVVKVFDGPDLDDLRSDIEPAFEYVRDMRPDASRDSSSELYLVAVSYITAPVAQGEERTLEVVEVGSEGDGIAKVDGYTVFVPDAEAGDSVDVRITDVKSNYAFAERVE